MNRKAFLACVLMCVILTGCETAKKISEVIKNPDIQVGSLKEQPSEITVTLLTEPDTNTNAEGESAAVDVQLVYLTDDSKLLAADYDQIASTPPSASLSVCPSLPGCCLMTTHRLSVSRRNNGWQLRPTPKLHRLRKSVRNRRQPEPVLLSRVWRRRCDIWTCYPKAIPAISFTASTLPHS